MAHDWAVAHYWVVGEMGRRVCVKLYSHKQQGSMGAHTKLHSREQRMLTGVELCT